MSKQNPVRDILSKVIELDQKGRSIRAQHALPPRGRGWVKDLPKVKKAYRPNIIIQNRYVEDKPRNELMLSQSLIKLLKCDGLPARREFLWNDIVSELNIRKNEENNLEKVLYNNNKIEVLGPKTDDPSAADCDKEDRYKYKPMSDGLVNSKEDILEIVQQPSNIDGYAIKDTIADAYNNLSNDINELVFEKKIIAVENTKDKGLVLYPCDPNDYLDLGGAEHRRRNAGGFMKNKRPKPEKEVDLRLRNLWDRVSLEVKDFSIKDMKNKLQKVGIDLPLVAKPFVVARKDDKKKSKKLKRRLPAFKA